MDPPENARILVCRLAYDAGVRRVDYHIRTLEGMRTRCMALVAVMLISAGIVAGIVDSPKGGLRWWGWAGLVLFLVCALVTTVAAIHVARPAWGIPAIGPREVLATHATESLTESDIYRNLAESLTVELQQWSRALGVRARSVTVSLVSTFLGMGGITLVWIDSVLL